MHLIIYVRQVNVVNGGDNVFTHVQFNLSFCLSVCVCTAAWHHNNNDVIMSPVDCILSVTSPAATFTVRTGRYSFLAIP